MVEIEDCAALAQMRVGDRLGGIEHGTAPHAAASERLHDLALVAAAGPATLRGVDVFHPQRGEVVSGGPESIALWFIDTDYNEESFFVRHAYFLGAETDPYKALKTTLKAEIDAEAWASLRSDTSRPFPKPRSGRIAVKAINHLGDEVMKVFSVRRSAGAAGKD